MKIGIMQPYLFPYIGYFQLINFVDKFVVYDDVQYIKSGWINRNRIIVNGRAHYFVLPLQKGSTFLKINERVFSKSIDKEKEKVIRQIELAYRKAPNFDSVMPFIIKSLAFTESNVSLFVAKVLQECCYCLQIDTPFQFSSAIENQDELTGQDRVIGINKILGAKHYVNPIGGVELYDREQFNRKGLKLSFLRTREFTYPQFSGNHIPFLSIIDVMMFNSLEKISSMLEEFDLL